MSGAQIQINLPSLSCYVFNPVVEISHNYSGQAAHINTSAIIDQTSTLTVDDLGVITNDLVTFSILVRADQASSSGTASTAQLLNIQFCKSAITGIEIDQTVSDFDVAGKGANPNQILNSGNTLSVRAYSAGGT